jgi:2,3-bisphosphoglycerate-dependent phosphoglycerate mutase
MSVGIQLDDELFDLARSDYVHAFFSNISFHLEERVNFFRTKGGWGSRFPALLNELYQGELPKTSAQAAVLEIEIVREEFKKITPDRVIWDIDDLKLRPPWGDEIAPDIKNLYDYFTTSDGEVFIDVLEKALRQFAAGGESCELR